MTEDSQSFDCQSFKNCALSATLVTTLPSIECLGLWVSYTYSVLLLRL